MMKTRPFQAAPWSWSIWLATGFVYVLMLGILIAGLFTGPRELIVWQLSMVALPIAFILISPFFMVRGYELDGETLRVQRLGWHSSVALRNIAAVEHDPEAMKGAWRTCGNGGLVCFAGRFRSKRLGKFRPFVTNPRYSVVIQTDRDTYVVSPAEPEAFAKAVER